MNKSKLVLSNEKLNKYKVLNIKYFLYSGSIKVTSLHRKQNVPIFFTPSLMRIVLRTNVSEIKLVVCAMAGMVMRDNFCKDCPPIRMSPGNSASGEAWFLSLSSLFVPILLRQTCSE